MRHVKNKKKKSHNFSTGILVFEDGTKFFGNGIGYEGNAIGEVCFNTSMTGYQEIITDPSYADQIINFTFLIFALFFLSNFIIVFLELEFLINRFTLWDLVILEIILANILGIFLNLPGQSFLL